MAIDFLYPQYEVVRNESRCIQCRVCERQCANEVHRYDADLDRMLSDESKCVNCHRCVALCPTRALKIEKSRHTFAENANWPAEAISDIYRQAGSGGVLLSSMGNPKSLPVYWDRLLLNASQVTNPSIDPLREPMETRVFLGRKSEEIRRDAQGRILPDMAPQLEPKVPVMFSAMSAPPANWARITTPARAACTRTFTSTARTPSYRWPPAVSAFPRIIWKRARPLKSRWDRGPSPASAGICPGRKLSAMSAARA